MNEYQVPCTMDTNEGLLGKKDTAIKGVLCKKDNYVAADLTKLRIVILL